MGNRSSITSHQQQPHHGLTCPSETDLTDFQLLRFIGAGTFGKVYVVFHKGLKKEYALKVMCKRRVCRRKFTENVLSELELLQGLSHPFISSLWYAFQDNEQIYMITDLLLGGDLSYHLKNQGRFSESRAKLLICELALALDYLHRQRVGHFDVKPANILLDEQGHAHLTDFGLAKRLADGELATTFSGTRPYMAPEILLTALGDMAGYDWRVDWWALGCCFYEMLRGRTPYEYPASFSSLQVLSIIYTRGVTMPSRWPSDLISFLRGIINAEKRWRIDDFDKFQQHSYMERIMWKDVFDRKMVPIFVPPKEHLDALSRRNYRATISVPLSKLHHLHHPVAAQQKPFLRHFKAKDQQQQQSMDGNNETHKELDDEIAKLSARFKKFNRFRCETQIVAPRQSLEVAMSRERRRIASKRSPKMAPHSARTSTRTPTTTTTTTMLIGNDINKRMGRTTTTNAVETQADKMRRIFHANNREVNYSM